jgi:tetratricopeptide (TPR) repeat protein
MRFRDAVVTPRTNEKGRLSFVVAQAGHPPRVLEVDAVVGGGMMMGGGTQAFFSEFPDGTLRFLPFDYSEAERRWFCQMRANRGWAPITPDVALTDCDAWPPRRVLGRPVHGTDERFQTCQQCHGSQIEIAFDSTAKRYETRFTSLAINCESCHGPGREHIELAQSGSRGSASGMRSLETLTKDQSLDVCFQCHAVKTALEPGYLPGKPLERHYALKLPQLLDTIFAADGRTRVFAYQEAHLASDCYLNGSMTCVDCHDPHSQGYRGIDGSPIAGRFSNDQCLGCHPSKAEPLERHTRHPPASPGSRCVACHMPYLQQPNVGDQIPYARSDHAIPIPRPGYDARLGIENACQQCHHDRTAEQLDAQVAAWYGELKPHPEAISNVVAAQRTSDATAATRIVLSAPSGRHPWAEFIGLSQIFRRYAGGELLALDEDILRGLEQRARSSDPEVQALALATLHLTRGADNGVRRFLARQLRALGPRDEVVRSRWVWILRVRGDAHLASGEPERAVATYRKALELDPNEPDVLRSVGVAYTRLRDYPNAIEHFKRSLALSPGEPPTLVGLGFALMQQGRLDSAILVYRRAIGANPWDPAGHANLGLVHLRRGAFQPAIEAFQEAIRLEPGLAAAHFALAEAYAKQGELQQATSALERGLEVDPRNTAARRMLEAIRPPQ